MYPPPYRRSDEIPDILLKFFENHVIQQDQHDASDKVQARDRRMKASSGKQRYRGTQRPRQASGSGSGSSGQGPEDIKHIYYRREPEPDLEGNDHDLLEIPQEDYQHGKEKSESISEDLLNNIDNRDNQEK